MVQTVTCTLVSCALLDCTRHLLHHRVILPFTYSNFINTNLAFLNNVWFYSATIREIILFIGIFPRVEICVYTAQI